MSEIAQFCLNTLRTLDQPMIPVKQLKYSPKVLQVFLISLAIDEDIIKEY